MVRANASADAREDARGKENRQQRNKERKDPKHRSTNEREKKESKRRNPRKQKKRDTRRGWDGASSREGLENKRPETGQGISEKAKKNRGQRPEYEACYVRHLKVNPKGPQKATSNIINIPVPWLDTLLTVGRRAPIAANYLTTR